MRVSKANVEIRAISFGRRRRPRRAAEPEAGVAARIMQPRPAERKTHLGDGGNAFGFAKPRLARGSRFRLVARKPITAADVEAAVAGQGPTLSHRQVLILLRSPPAQGLGIKDKEIFLIHIKGPRTNLASVCIPMARIPPSD